MNLVAVFLLVIKCLTAYTITYSIGTGNLTTVWFGLFFVVKDLRFYYAIMLQPMGELGLLDKNIIDIFAL